jgi:hypothetical protein
MPPRSSLNDTFDKSSSTTYHHHFSKLTQDNNHHSDNLTGITSSTRMNRNINGTVLGLKISTVAESSCSTCGSDYTDRALLYVYIYIFFTFNRYYVRWYCDVVYHWISISVLLKNLYAITKRLVYLISLSSASTIGLGSSGGTTVEKNKIELWW